MYCVVIGCKSKWSENGDISFHSFPKDQERTDKWLKNLNLLDFTPKRHSKICSEHFSPESFNRTLTIVKLRENSLPTITQDLSPEIQDEINRKNLKRKLLSKKVSPPVKRSKPSSQPFDISLMDIGTNIQLDHSYSLPPPKVIKRRIQFHNEKLSELCSRSHKYKRTISNLSKRVKKLVGVAKKLKSQKMTAEEALSSVDNMSDVPKKLFERMQHPSNGKKDRRSYPPELRAFALKLFLHSTKAYSYVRRTFGWNLPSLSAIRNWCDHADKDPELPESTSDILRAKTKEVFVNLSLD